MAGLKLGPIADEKPVRITAEIPAKVHRDLVAYASVLARETDQVLEPGQLVAPMLKKFMATDRAFLKARRSRSQTSRGPIEPSASALARDSESA